MSPNTKPLISAGILLGIGLGGFVDGIVFHQILQLHNMLSNVYFPNTVVNIEVNMFWDGVFHAFTWVMTVAGLAVLWKAIKKDDVLKSGSALFGAMLLGFGIFNFVEGIIDHLVLQIHHVIQRGSSQLQFSSDLLFLLSGIILITLGFYLVKKHSSVRRADF